MCMHRCVVVRLEIENFGGGFPPFFRKGENTPNPTEIERKKMNNETHPFDIQVADSISKPPRKFDVPDHREAIGFDAGPRYTLGEVELLHMLGGFEDETRVFNAQVEDMIATHDHQIKNVKASRAYGPDWYASHTFRLEDWLSGDVFAYGLNDPHVFVLESEEDAESVPVDEDIQNWLMGADVSIGEVCDVENVA